MSTLTKVFVVLLVICSMLLTAATVTFVNLAEDHKGAFDAERAAREQAVREKQNAEDAIQQMTMGHKASIDVANRAKSDAEAREKQARNDLAAAEAEKGKLNTQLAVAAANNAKQAEALKVVQDTLSAVHGRNEKLVAENDKLRSDNLDLATRSIDLEKRLAVADRELRYTQEELTQAKGKLTAATNLIDKHRLTLDTSKPAPTQRDIKGYIRAVKPQDGQVYATISVGTSDKVEKGMQFYIVNQSTNEFLGMLTVDAVEPGEAFGRVEGPRVAEVSKGSQVRTQL